MTTKSLSRGSGTRSSLYGLLHYPTRPFKACRDILLIFLWHHIKCQSLARLRSDLAIDVVVFEQESVFLDIIWPDYIVDIARGVLPEALESDISRPSFAATFGGGIAGYSLVRCRETIEEIGCRHLDEVHAYILCTKEQSHVHLLPHLLHIPREKQESINNSDSQTLALLPPFTHLRLLLPLLHDAGVHLCLTYRILVFLRLQFWRRLAMLLDVCECLL